jgi:hypothetical protein
MRTQTMRRNTLRYRALRTRNADAARMRAYKLGELIAGVDLN